MIIHLYLYQIVYLHLLRLISLGVKKTKCGGGVAKKIEGGMQERGKEDKMRGGGGCEKKLKGDGAYSGEG